MVLIGNNVPIYMWRSTPPFNIFGFDYAYGGGGGIFLKAFRVMIAWKDGSIVYDIYHSIMGCRDYK